MTTSDIDNLLKKRKKKDKGKQGGPGAEPSGSQAGPQKRQKQDGISGVTDKLNERMHGATVVPEPAFLKYKKLMNKK